MIIENVNVATPINKKFVTGSDFDSLQISEHVDISIKNGIIDSISPTNDQKGENRWVIPAFTDPHTHLVFCGGRENEIDLRKKVGYEGVLKAGGGIYSTIDSTTKCDLDTLYLQSRGRMLKMMFNGTAAFEIKTGYGLTLETEDKMLKAIELLEKNLKVTTKKTLLAHVLPKGIEEEAYLGQFNQMIEEFRKRIDYVDVFVDEGAFSPSFARNAIQFANSLGIPARIHLNELMNLGGIGSISDLKVSSFDHMLGTKEAELDQINGAITVLPFTAMVLSKIPLILIKMKEKGKILCIGSDASPNTYITSLPLVLSIARQITPFTLENLINMGTLNSSYSLSLSDTLGSIHPCKNANFIVLNDNFTKLGYEFGFDHIEKVFIDGKEVRNSIKAQENQGT